MGAVLPKVHCNRIGYNSRTGTSGFKLLIRVENLTKTSDIHKFFLLVLSLTP